MPALVLVLNRRGRDPTSHPEVTQFPLLGTCCVPPGRMLGELLVLAQLILAATDEQFASVIGKISEEQVWKRDANSSLSSF